jgi:hypothetical protein
MSVINFWLDRKKNKDRKKEIEKRIIGIINRNYIPKIIPIKKKTGN